MDNSSADVRRQSSVVPATGTTATNEKDTFKESWKSLVAERGLNDTTVRFILDESRPQASEVFLEHFATLVPKEKRKAIDVLCEAAKTATASDRAKYAPVLFRCTAHMLSAKEPPELVAKLLSACTLAKSAKKELFRDVAQAYLDFFIRHINPDVLLPFPDDIKLTESTVSFIGKVHDDALKLLKEQSKAQPIDTTLIEELTEWIQSIGQFGPAAAIRSLEAVIEFLQDEKQKNRKGQQAIRNRDKEIRRLRNSLDLYREKSDKLEARVKEKDTELTAAAARERELTGQLKDKSRMIDIVQRNASSAASERHEQLADLLHEEYTDFLEAKDVTMDSTLGENLRDQLERVFDMLKDSGVMRSTNATH